MHRQPAAREVAGYRVARLAEPVRRGSQTTGMQVADERPELVGAPGEAAARRIGLGEIDERRPFGPCLLETGVEGAAAQVLGSHAAAASLSLDRSWRTRTGRTIAFNPANWSRRCSEYAVSLCRKRWYQRSFSQMSFPAEKTA